MSGDLSIRQVYEDRVRDFENLVKSCPQVEMTVRHYFIPGAYIRELTIPAGVMLVGKRHKTDHVSIMLEGEMIVIGKDGQHHIHAPYFHQGSAGSKRVGMAVKTSRWITVHITTLTNLDEIDQAEFYSEESMFDFRTGEIQINTLSRIRMDYGILCAEIGYSDVEIRHECEIESDIILVDLESLGTEIRPSPIEGLGLFSTCGFKAGNRIGPARTNGRRTQLGRYTNHSPDGNAAMVTHDDGVDMIATSDIQPGDEILIDYRTSPRYLEVKG